MQLILYCEGIAGYCDIVLNMWRSSANEKSSFHLH